MKKDSYKTKQAAVHMPEIDGEADFRTSINKAIESGMHVDALRGIVKEFEAYKAFFAEALKPCPTVSDTVFTFRFTYQLKKGVWREFEVLGNQTLDQLAEAVIKSMGWDNDHLDAFFFSEDRDGERWDWYTKYAIGSAGYEDGQYPTFCTDDVLVAAVNYAAYLKIGFVFDFGDDHRFYMEFKGTRTLGKEDKAKQFPVLIDQGGVAPEQYPAYEE